VSNDARTFEQVPGHYEEVTAIPSRPPHRSQHKILYVSASSPVPAKIGPARRNVQIIEQLARFFDVSVVSIGTPDDAAAFTTSFGAKISRARFVAPAATRYRKVLRKVWLTATGRCDFLPGTDQKLRNACAEVLGTESFDAIVLSCVLLAAVVPPTTTPIVGDTHNVEFDVLRRTSACADRYIRRRYSGVQAIWTRRAECRCARRVGLLLATSERDEDMFRDELGAREVAVVPNGIDLREFAPADATATTDILFSGLMSYYPNEQGVRWFLDSVFPTVRRLVPSARLVVAGAAPPSWLRRVANESIEVTGPVADMRPYLNRVGVVIAPLFIGGGTRVKVLEALATQRPVVSTSVGIEGLHLQHGRSVLVADDPITFARHVARVLTDSALSARLAQQGREHVIARFDWNRIGERLATIVHDRAFRPSGRPQEVT
jgi:polysaccharide biosynthesis protein PslH